MSNNSFFAYIKNFILSTLIFLFPLFFLPTTQEFFITAKLYLLSLGALLLLLVSSVELLVSKKLFWQKKLLDTPIILFVITIGLSIIISSPNKLQALLNPAFGLVSILALTILYFYLSREKKLNVESLTFNLSSLLLSLFTLIFFFQPFKNFSLPAYLQFLKNPNFTPLGNQLDLAIFLGFFVVIQLAKILTETNQTVRNKPNNKIIFNFSLLTFNLIALSLTMYSILKPTAPASNLQLPASSLLLPPFRLSWYAAVETLKNPLTALFGVGVDNYASIFTRVKDLSYNQSPLWQLNSFTVSRSTLLHIATETGLFGLIAFGLLLFGIIKELFLKQPASPAGGYSNIAIKQSFSPLLFTTLYLILVLLFFPPSLVVFFLFFLMLSVISRGGENAKFFATWLGMSAPLESLGGAREPTGLPAEVLTKAGVKNTVSSLSDKKPAQKDAYELRVTEFMPLYLSLIIVSFVFIFSSAYLLTRSFAAEFYFKKSLDGLLKNNAKDLYDNQRQAVILNPHIERFRVNFSQTNLLIANNIASKASPPFAQRAKGDQSNKLTDQDRQIIAQAIQTAISEAKAAVGLNPQKAGNWENLANIYRNIINVAQGADIWTISSYQRAIMADPQNPNYRLALGGIYYAFGNYDEAIKLFEQSVGLKSDWANAFYNLAWASYQKGDYQKAALAMQNALNLIDPRTNSNDYNKAQKELEEFKTKLPKTEEEATKSNQTQQQLTLPTPPATQLEPKIELPEEASPEAR